ncbi:MAG: glycoside hydrolase family 97 protein [Bacteroidetes bacterium]|nr:glycoside hydrolase family 97 protein [Bacteroidota bacterium]
MALGVVAQAPKTFSVASPDGKTVVQVIVGAPGAGVAGAPATGGQLQWSVSRGGKVILAPSSLGMKFRGGELGFVKGVAVKKESVNQSIATLHYKKDSVRDHYNQLTVTAGTDGVIFRAYDDGVAYRFVTHRKDSLVVLSETADFNFPSDYMAWIPYINHGRPDIYSTSFESLYEHIPVSSFKKDTLAFLPVLVDAGVKVGILEADLEEYPGMFVGPGKGSATGLSGVQAPYPLEEKQGGHNQLQSLVVRRGDYIATTAGTRSFPWRVLVIADNDKELLDNDMVYRLASPSRVSDVSWIKPGKVAWDWWNDWNISHVDFRAGINTATYKYYIDFAAANRIPYILLDEGWADSKDIMNIVPEIDLAGIIEYGRQKNVGVWLWGGWLPLDQKIDEALGYYSRLGIKGFKIDFMDRDDQKLVQFYYRMSAAAARYHLMLDFHGAYKPTGLQRTFPNVVNFEGVRGMENAKWANDDFPGYDVTIPYIRMLSGPMDYTPGAMKNANKRNFRSVNAEPMSQGTRCHQLAMYVVYEAPFSMLADNPTNYMREKESVDFIAGVPEVWDQTVALDGKVGEWVAVARRKGTDWWVGAMGDWSERDVVVDLSFLPAGNYQMEVMKDGINADRDGTDYKKETVAVAAGTKVKVHLAPGGGWVAKLRPVR